MVHGTPPLQTSISCLAIYHVDIPSTGRLLYAPSALAELRYLATSILTVHAFGQTVAKKQAAAKSLSEPVFGLAEEKDGVVIASKKTVQHKGFVIEMAFRRKSGRAIEETFFVPFAHVTSKPPPPILLADHAVLQPRPGVDVAASGLAEFGSTFDLGLTERQRQDRDAVILPYFDAQKIQLGQESAPQKSEQALNEGGRILYDMGVEDDFDEEEDEI